MAIDRHVVIAFRVNELRQIRAISSYGDREVSVALGQQVPGPAGDWANYIRAAIDTVCRKWTIIRGLDAALVSNLPVAAGLSSSSAVMIAFVIALPRVNGVKPNKNP